METHWATVQSYIGVSCFASREELLNGCVVSGGAYRIKLIGASYHAEGNRISIGHTLPTLTGLKEEIRPPGVLFEVRGMAAKISKGLGRS